MKATLIPESPVFTLNIDGKLIPGMRQDGQLGPVLLLKSADGHEAYVFDGTSPFAKAFKLLGDGARDVTLIAGNPLVMDAIYPPKTTDADVSPQP